MQKLTEEQITLYEKLSGTTIDRAKSSTDKLGRYWNIGKNGSQWRSYISIINWLNFKANKINSSLDKHNKQHNNEPNTIHINKHNNVEFKQGNKTRRLCLNMTLTLDEFKKLQSLGKTNNITWSNAATQIVKSYLKSNA